jgi:hypothetical protein
MKHCCIFIYFSLLFIHSSRAQDTEIDEPIIRPVYANLYLLSNIGLGMTLNASIKSNFLKSKLVLCANTNISNLSQGVLISQDVAFNNATLNNNYTDTRGSVMFNFLQRNIYKTRKLIVSSNYSNYGGRGPTIGTSQHIKIKYHRINQLGLAIGYNKLGSPIKAELSNLVYTGIFPYSILIDPGAQGKNTKVLTIIHNNQLSIGINYNIIRNVKPNN